MIWPHLLFIIFLTFNNKNTFPLNVACESGLNDCREGGNYQGSPLTCAVWNVTEIKPPTWLRFFFFKSYTSGWLYHTWLHPPVCRDNVSSCLFPRKPPGYSRLPWACYSCSSSSQCGVLCRRMRGKTVTIYLPLKACGSSCLNHIFWP